MRSNITLPNLITVARLILVPVVIWFITDGRMALAFAGFAVAGISDGIDGYIARRWDLRSELGAFLDPIADKALLMSIYVSLGILGILPHWLAILVVARDVLIMGAVILSWGMGRQQRVRPIFISKLNTTAQIVLAGLALADIAFGWELAMVLTPLVWATAALTIASGAAYLRSWLTLMSGAPMRIDGGDGEDR